jgi:hypothetical protein
MPVTVDILEESDVSTSSADFQADGTAAAGSTGRVADAGHVHPAASSSTYQIVTEDILAKWTYPGNSYGPGSPFWNDDVPFVVAAPTGYAAVNGGYTLPGQSSVVAGGPSSSGDRWQMNSNPFGTSGTYNSVLGQMYAICVATS